MLSHPGEEFTHVLEGSLEFHSELCTPLQLETGESVYFDSGMPHAYVATSDGPCRVLTICSSTPAQLYDALDRSRPPLPENEALHPSRGDVAKARGAGKAPGPKPAVAKAKPRGKP